MSAGDSGRRANGAATEASSAPPATADGEEPHGERGRPRPPSPASRSGRHAREREREGAEEERASASRGAVAASAARTRTGDERRADPERPVREERGRDQRGGECDEPHRGRSTTIRQPPRCSGVGADRAAVEVDDPAGDREAEAASALVARAAGVAPVEALEDALGLLGRDPGPLIDDLEPRRAVPGGGANEHAASARGSGGRRSRRGSSSTWWRRSSSASTVRAASTADSSSTCSLGGPRPPLVDHSRDAAPRPGRSSGRAGRRRTRAWRGRGAARRACPGARPGGACPSRVFGSTGSTPSTTFSSVARSAPIGVRSSWEAFATRSRRIRSTSASSAAIELNARASSPTSSREVAVTRRA